MKQSSGDKAGLKMNFGVIRIQMDSIESRDPGWDEDWARAQVLWRFKVWRGEKRRNKQRWLRSIEPKESKQGRYHLPWIGNWLGNRNCAPCCRHITSNSYNITKKMSSSLGPIIQLKLRENCLEAENYLEAEWDCALGQWSPTFLASGTCFVEENTESGDGFRMIQAHYIYCTLYFYYYQLCLSSSGIRSQRLGALALGHKLQCLALNSHSAS